MDVARRAWQRLIVVGVLVLSGCSGPTTPDRTSDDASSPPPAPVTLSATAAEIVDLTNSERTRAGLPSLRTNARLTEAARLHAEQVAAAGLIEHVLPDARYP